MTVGVLRVSALLRGAHSLKEKRQVLRSLKDRVRHTFNVAVAEVDDQDFCQSLEVGIATVGTDPQARADAIARVPEYLARHLDGRP